jgi:hypothetical protein
MNPVMEIVIGRILPARVDQGLLDGGVCLGCCEFHLPSQNPDLFNHIGARF